MLLPVLLYVIYLVGVIRVLELSVSIYSAS